MNPRPIQPSSGPFMSTLPSERASTIDTGEEEEPEYEVEEDVKVDTAPKRVSDAAPRQCKLLLRTNIDLIAALPIGK